MAVFPMQILKTAQLIMLLTPTLGRYYHCPNLIDKGTEAKIGFWSKSLEFLRGILVNALNQATSAKPTLLRHYIPAL